MLSISSLSLKTNKVLFFSLNAHLQVASLQRSAHLRVSSIFLHTNLWCAPLTRTATPPASPSPTCVPRRDRASNPALDSNQEPSLPHRPPHLCFFEFCHSLGGFLSRHLTNTLDLYILSCLLWLGNPIPPQKDSSSRVGGAYLCLLQFSECS